MSADAGVAAANWAFWQMVLSGAGFAGLLYSLYLTRKATIAAADAGKETARAIEAATRDAEAAENLVVISRENGERQLRAYLDFVEYDFVDEDMKFSEEASTIGIRFKLQNFGQTPARDIKISADYFDTALDGGGRAHIASMPVQIGAISPTDFARVRRVFEMPPSMGNRFKNGTRMITVCLRANYKDSFGHDRHVSIDLWTRGIEGIFAVEDSQSWS